MLTSEFLDALKNRQVCAVLDNDDVAALFREFGFSDIANYDGFDFKSNDKPLFVLPTSFESQRKMNKSLWGETGGIFVHLTASKFDPALPTLRYSLEKLLSIADFQSVINYRDDMYEKALSAQGGIKIHTANGHCLDCTLADEIETANYDEELKSGWLYSLAEFFETSIVNVEANKSSFCANGRFAFTGITHLENSPELKAASATLIQDMVNLSQQGDNWIECQDNSITQIVMGGQDITQTLIESTAGTLRELSLTEFAFGAVPHEQLDWRVNSVLNEGVLGVHLGIGMGLDMPHVDFIAAGARVEFIQ